MHGHIITLYMHKRDTSDEGFLQTSFLFDMNICLLCSESFLCGKFQNWYEYRG